MPTTFKNIDEFIAQYPCAEIASTRRWSRWVSGSMTKTGMQQTIALSANFAATGG